jgi:hypothetical protein
VLTSNSFLRSLFKVSPNIIQPTLSILLCLAALTLRAQQINIPELSLRCDTIVYSERTASVKWADKNAIWFRTNDPREICELTFHVAKQSGFRKIRIKPSSRFRIIDSLSLSSENTWRGKIRFNDLLASGQELIAIRAISDSGRVNEFEYPVLPIMDPFIQLPAGNIELMQDEEKVIELPVKNGFNIKTEGNWVNGKTVDYKINPSQHTIQLIVRTHMSGSQSLVLNLHTIKPILNSQFLTSTELPPLMIGFYSRPFKLNYINCDKNKIYLDPGLTHTEQVLMDYNHSFEMNKSYRIEDRKESGGVLIAELTTQSQVENSSKIICRMRCYSRHRTADGYLFIKDGDKALFMTNLNILDRPEISSMLIRHEGAEWESSASVHPGETVDIRLEGKGLQSAGLEFESCPDFRVDTSRSTDESLFISLHIPSGTIARKISLYLNKHASAFELNVAEYQRPHPLDFVSLNFGGRTRSLDDPELSHPVFLESTIADAILQFDPSKIDQAGDLYGKQYLTVKVELINNDDDLIEQEDFKLCICPSTSGIRGLYYDRKGCNEGTLSINDKLRHKTYGLDPFTQIIITVRHDESKYKESDGFERKIRLFVKRSYKIDLQISFPTGLLYKSFGETGIGNLSGLGICALAQINFYDENRPGKFRPYSLGAGFISLNTFNFNEGPNDRRDIGLIVAATVIPYKSKSKFSFPIYFGTGYLLKASKGFIMVGPGVQVDF